MPHAPATTNRPFITSINLQPPLLLQLVPQGRTQDPSRRRGHTDSICVTPATPGLLVSMRSFQSPRYQRHRQLDIEPIGLVLGLNAPQLASARCSALLCDTSSTRNYVLCAATPSSPYLPLQQLLSSRSPKLSSPAKSAKEALSRPVPSRPIPSRHPPSFWTTTHRCHDFNYNYKSN